MVFLRTSEANTNSRENQHAGEYDSRKALRTRGIQGHGFNAINPDFLIAITFFGQAHFKRLLFFTHLVLSFFAMGLKAFLLFPLGREEPWLDDFH